MRVSRLVLDCGEFEAAGENGFTLNGRRIPPEDCHSLQSALRVAVLCNNAFYDAGGATPESRGVGDPLEIALLAAAARAGMKKEDLGDAFVQVREEAFDAESKMMATFYAHGDDYFVGVKGAPEEVLKWSHRVLTGNGATPLTEKSRREWTARVEGLAGQGLRVLALAQKSGPRMDAQPYEELTLIGLVGLLDPPRSDIRDSLKAARTAGIKVVMVTGDQALTARNIASAVGLAQEEEMQVVHGKEMKAPHELSADERRRLTRIPIFARVTPQQKLDLIALYQAAGEVVAMTGDGVNDAPALKKADIGIAMGQRGTQVAKEAADMVLKDDAFTSIVAAIWQGRVIFDNIRKFVIYLISCNVSEIACVALASIANWTLPLLPLQILFLNLVTDVFPALALGMGQGGPDVMGRAPRPAGESIVAGRHWAAIGGYGLLITAAVFGAFAFAVRGLGLAEKEAVSISFLTLALAQLWHVFNLSAPGENFLRNDITRNRYVWAAVGLCLALILVAVCVPLFAGILAVVPPAPKGWIVILLASLFPLAAGRIYKRTINV
jgi:Ca2+-transporting ATPase